MIDAGLNASIAPSNVQVGDHAYKVVLRDNMYEKMYFFTRDIEEVSSYGLCQLVGRGIHPDLWISEDAESDSGVITSISFDTDFDTS